MSSYNVKRRIVSAAPGAAADVEIIPAVAGKRFAVLAWFVVGAAAAAHGRFRSGTNELFVGGSATQGLPLGTNSGLSIPEVGDPPDPWMITNTGEALNYRVEVAGELTVGVIYEER